MKYSIRERIRKRSRLDSPADTEKAQRLNANPAILHIVCVERLAKGNHQRSATIDRSNGRPNTIKDESRRGGSGHTADQRANKKHVRRTSVHHTVPVAEIPSNCSSHPTQYSTETMCRRCVQNC